MFRTKNHKHCVKCGDVIIVENFRLFDIEGWCNRCIRELAFEAFIKETNRLKLKPIYKGE